MDPLATVFFRDRNAVSKHLALKRFRFVLGDRSLSETNRIAVNQYVGVNLSVNR